jgi:hypothetical protein
MYFISHKTLNFYNYNEANIKFFLEIVNEKYCIINKINDL